MLATLLTLLLALSAIITLDRMLTKKNMVDEVTALSQVIAARSEVALSFGDKRNSQSNLDALKNSPEYVLGCLYGADPTQTYSLFGQFPKNSTTAKCPESPPVDLSQFEPITSHFIHLWTPVIRNQNDSIGFLYLRRSLQSLNERVTRFTLASAVISILVLIIGSLIIARLQRIISKPILDLSKISTKISENSDYQLRATVTSTDEVGALSSAFNTMLDTIEKTQNELTVMAFYDALTGLPNRRYFMETLERAMTSVQRGHRSIALLLIDLDGFKSVNDTIGHDAGDMVLTTVSERMPLLLRKSDMVARLGGDEFTVILSDVVTPASLRKIALSLIRAIEEPILFKGQKADVSASVGIAMAPSDATSMDVLLKLADAAMYRAKAGGKKTFYFFNEEIDAEMKLAEAQEKNLHHSLLTCTSRLLYQPILQLDKPITQGILVTLAPFDSANSMNQTQTNTSSETQLETIPSKIRHIADPVTSQLMLDKMLEQLILDIPAIAKNLSPTNTLILVLPVANTHLRNPEFIEKIQTLLKQLTINSLNLKLAVDRGGFENQVNDALRPLLALSDDGDGIENLGGISDVEEWCLATVPRNQLTDWEQLAWNNLLNAGKEANATIIGIGIHTHQQLKLTQSLGLLFASGNLMSKPLAIKDLEIWIAKDMELNEPKSQLN